MKTESGFCRYLLFCVTLVASGLFVLSETDAQQAHSANGNAQDESSALGAGDESSNADKPDNALLKALFFPKECTQELSPCLQSEINYGVSIPEFRKAFGKSANRAWGLDSGAYHRGIISITHSSGQLCPRARGMVDGVYFSLTKGFNIISRINSDINSRIEPISNPPMSEGMTNRDYNCLYYYDFDGGFVDKNSIATAVFFNPSGQDKYDTEHTSFGLGSLAVVMEQHNDIEYDLFLDKYVEHYKNLLPNPRVIEGEASLHPFKKKMKSKATYLIAQNAKEIATVKIVAEKGNLIIVRNVTSMKLAARLGQGVLEDYSRHWLKVKKKHLGVSTAEELFDYQLAAVKKYKVVDPKRALEHLEPLVFFNTRKKEVDELRKAALAEMEKRLIREQKEAAKKEAARKKSAKARANERAKRKKAVRQLWKGVDRKATLEKAVFDINSVKGKTVLWQGYVVKSLDGMTYLASTNGTLWAFRVPGRLSGPGLVSIKGIVADSTEVTDGMRVIQVPLVLGKSVSFPY